MQAFKKRWEITKNWQLLYPFIGVLALLYSAYKLVGLFNVEPIWATLVLTVAIFVALLWITLRLFKFLEKRWEVSHRWKVIRIFMVFAITGSMSVMISNPLFELVGFTKSLFANFGGNALFYTLKFLLILPIYKVLLVFFGWLFGEYNFFFNFALKMLKRMGFKNWVERLESK